MSVRQIYNDNIFISYRIDINHISNVPFKTVGVMYVPPNLIQRSANRACRCLPCDSHSELRFFPLQYSSTEFYVGSKLCSLWSKTWIFIYWCNLA